MSTDTVLFKKDLKAAYMTLNRPDEANKLDLAVAYQIESACQAVTDDESIQAVVLNATGDAFCVGEELEDLLLEGPGSVLQSPGQIVVGAISRLPIPVVAVVNGPCHGAGLELALACDIRLASETATFLTPELSYGYIPHSGATQRLPRVVGKAKALEMVLTGEAISATEALRIGLVSKVLSSDQLDQEARTLATKLSEKAPIALRYAKEVVIKGMDVTLEQGMRLEGDLYFLLQTTQDRMEGIRAFLERRTPNFEGR